MKKTIFVGRVNEHEFDNWNDYNACVQAMIDMDAPFHASTSTQVVECKDECVCKGDQCKCNKKPLKAVADYLPASEHLDNGEYIDRMICGSYEEFDQKMSQLEEDLCKLTAVVSGAIPQNTFEQLEVYRQSVYEVRDRLTVDCDKTENVLTTVNEEIDKINAKLKELEDKREMLNRSLDVIDLYSNFYEEVIEDLHEASTFRNMKGLGNKPASKQEDEVVMERNVARDKFTEGIKRLFDEVFHN